MKHHFNMFKMSIFYVFTLSVATATVSVDTIKVLYIFRTFIFSVNTKCATATVSVDTLESGPTNYNIILTCLH